MKRCIAAFLAFCFMSLSADTWQSAQFIPMSTSNGVYGDVHIAYDEGMTKGIAVWADVLNRRPFYALFDGSKWWPAVPVCAEVVLGAKNNVYLVYDETHQVAVAAWTDYISSKPYFAAFNGQRWSPGQPIPFTDTVLHDVFVAYDPALGKVIAVWSNQNKLPYYSLFDGRSWSTPAPIPPGGSDGAMGNVMLAYDAQSQSMIAAWANANGASLYYSTFNGTAWTSAAAIPGGTGLFDVCLAFDPVAQKVIAAWANGADRAPYFSQFDGTAWTTAALLPQGASTGVKRNVALAYNSYTKTVCAAWADSSTSQPYAAAFNGSGWSTASPIPAGASSGARFNVYLAFDVYYREMIATWTNATGSFNPCFSTDK